MLVRNSVELCKDVDRLMPVPPGDCLISSGDDGTVRFWKKSISGEWMEFAETDMADEYASSS
jgi:hypothetical protein